MLLNSLFNLAIVQTAENQTTIKLIYKKIYLGW